MGFLNRRRSPPPPSPAPPAVAVQPPKPIVVAPDPSSTVQPSSAVKSQAASKQDTPGGVSRTPTMKTSARGVMSDAPLQYASLLGRLRQRSDGRMMM